MRKLLLFIALLLILGCAQAKNFSYGLKQVNILNSRYNTTMETYPKAITEINSMLKDYNELKKMQLNSGQEPFNYVIDYRILNLEAEKFYIDGQRYGSIGTTKDGFGCKSRPLIIESAQLRNQSAQRAFDAVDLIRKFVQNYPDEAKQAGFSEKNALFLNATFYEVWREARRDNNIINAFCPENVTLELYQEEFRKKTNLSEEFIKNLSYGEAAEIWKQRRGYA